MFMKFLKIIPVYLVKAYQYALSPYCSGCCRYTPTCSNYAIAAFNKYGLLKGAWLSFKRILKCHPFRGSSGYDPLP